MSQSFITVTILNPQEVKELFADWGEFSAVCYNSRPSPKIGQHCMNSGHWSGSRWRYIAMQIDNCPRFVIDQLVRHEQGVIKNVQSFRYVNKNNFNYTIPEEIKGNDTLETAYWEHMNTTVNLYHQIQEYVLNKTGKAERANEQARYILPMATESSVCIAFTPEALMHYCNLRLCTRTEDIHRQLAQAIKNAVVDIIPELKDKLVPQCEYLMWCPESKGCGRYLSKKELKEIINANINS